MCCNPTDWDLVYKNSTLWPQNLGISFPQWPPLIHWRDPQVWRWYADIGWATAMAPTINRTWNKVIIVGEKQKVVMHYLPDTSPGSSNQMAPSMTRPCRFMNAYESIVLCSSSSGFLGILEADFCPRSCLDPYIRTMSLSEWMGGQQHTWRIATMHWCFCDLQISTNGS